VGLAALDPPYPLTLPLDRMRIIDGSQLLLTHPYYDGTSLPESDWNQSLQTSATSAAGCGLGAAVSLFRNQVDIALGRPVLLLISQVYVPDPASVGQHLHDAAAEMVRRGTRVRVLASARGYDSPQDRYPARETIDGVEVRRLPLSSFGKRSLAVRVTAQLCFLLQAIVRGLLQPKLDAVLVSTSPPMCSVAALIVAAIRRVPIVYWVMDINPDQAVAMNLARKGSPAVRAYEALNRLILARAYCVVTLDRFMANRLLQKRNVAEKLAVFPPWPHEDQLEPVRHEDNPFRRTHRLEGKFVVMHSGNHSASHPISTVLEAAQRLQSRDDVAFVFVGGGRRKAEVDRAIARGAENIVSLPYQPLSELRYSLSAADVHVVSLGNAMVGIVHPCKIYGALAVARPIMLIGPSPSHASDIVERCDVGRRIEHGNVDATVRAIGELAGMPPARRAAMGRTAQEFIRRNLSRESLCGRLADLIEAALQRKPLPRRKDHRAFEPTAISHRPKKAA